MNITYQDFVPVLNEYPEIREKVETVNGQEFRTISYMVATTELWDNPLCLEARGITFDDRGNCVCRTMEKFFNVNENKFTQMSNLDFSGAYAFDKLDGSMVTPVRLGDKIVMKSKKSFYSDVAIAATKWIHENQHYIDFCNHMIDNGITPTFEFMHPDHQIVVEVQEPTMTLLVSRHISTGYYTDYGVLQDIANHYGVDIVHGEPVQDIQYYMDLAKTIEGVEGWVFQLASGQRVKLKTEWYLRRHKLTNYHERDIFDMILDESLDDVAAAIKEKPGAWDKVEQISHRVHDLMKHVKGQVDGLMVEWSGMDLADIGKQYNQHPVFSLAISQFRGKEPDYKKFLINNYRKDFSTNPVFWGFG